MEEEEERWRLGLGKDVLYPFVILWSLLSTSQSVLLVWTTDHRSVNNPDGLLVVSGLTHAGQNISAKFWPMARAS
jgi:hypothetical protein